MKENFKIKVLMQADEIDEVTDMDKVNELLSDNWSILAVAQGKSSFIYVMGVAHSEKTRRT